jgi:hypothetical protein
VKILPSARDALLQRPPDERSRILGILDLLDKASPPPPSPHRRDGFCIAHAFEEGEIVVYEITTDP